MRFGCCTGIEYYQILSDLGFEYIELMGKYLASIDNHEFAKVHRIITEGKIPCLALNAYCPPEILIAGPGYNRESVHKYADLCSKRANEIGVKTVSVGAPKSRIIPDGYPHELAMSQAIDFFEITAEIFAHYGITVCVEALGTCYCNFINTLQEAVDVVRAVHRENVKVVLDFYNMEHNGEADIDLKFAMSYISHVHISDDDGLPTRRYFLKEEKFEIHARRLKMLGSLGYDAAVSVEIDLPVDPILAKSNLMLLNSVNEQLLIK